MFSNPSLETAAYELGRDGVLSDPSDETLLVAAAELAGSDIDLTTVNGATLAGIVEAWYRGNDAWQDATLRENVEQMLDEQEAREGYCKHGVYVGGCGIDWMCGQCESE